MAEFTILGFVCQFIIFTSKAIKGVWCFWEEGCLERLLPSHPISPPPTALRAHKLHHRRRQYHTNPVLWLQQPNLYWGSRGWYWKTTEAVYLEIRELMGCARAKMILSAVTRVWLIVCASRLASTGIAVRCTHLYFSSEAMQCFCIVNANLVTAPALQDLIIGHVEL